MRLLVDGLSKSYGSVLAVDGVDLEVTEGETLALLGPSGCGKSTLLRLIAGLERPDRGRVVLQGKDVTSWPPQRRDLGMVFQDFALFPHLNVAGNVGFALVEEGWARSRLRPRVAELLEMVGLGGYEKRKVYELSGGQQQRVALARALASRPALLLLDEPLSNLDPELRGNLQLELREILRSLEITAVYVTHDQSEAFTVARRVAVMRAGRIMRDGVVDDLLADPRRPWTARFLGYRNVFGPGETTLAGQADRPVLVRDDLLELRAPHAGDLSARVVSFERTGHLLRVRLAVQQWGAELLWEGYERELPLALSVGTDLDITVPQAALVLLETE